MKFKTVVEATNGYILVQRSVKSFVWYDGSFPVSVGFRSVELAINAAKVRGWM